MLNITYDEIPLSDEVEVRHIIDGLQLQQQYPEQGSGEVP
jgi:hypothetical protein